MIFSTVFPDKYPINGKQYFLYSLKSQYIIYKKRSGFYAVGFTDISSYMDLQISIHTPFLECLN